ncbi:hypothetical protein D3C80_1435740 [compost metagenome]
MHLRTGLGSVEAGVELGVVEFIVTERSKELVRAVARQFALVGVAALAAGELLVNQQHTQPAQHSQQRNAAKALAQVGAGRR